MSPDDAYGLIRKHCLAKPDAVEEYPWGDVVWKIRGKIFAGSSDGSNRVSVKATLEEQARLIQHPAIEKARYVGRFGWVTITVKNKKVAQLARELIDESYSRVAPGSKPRPRSKPRPKSTPTPKSTPERKPKRKPN